MKYLWIIAILISLAGTAQEKLFEVDGYEVPDEVISANYGEWSNRKEINDIESTEKAWFVNSGQVLIFQLATDYHRYMTWQFSSADIPEELAETIIFYTKEGEIATKEQTLRVLPHFISLAKYLPERYFSTMKGLQLGIAKELALSVYNSKPDNISESNGVEIYEWSFPGDISISEGYEKANGKPVAKDSFGHKVILFFRDEKLIGMILVNEIP